MARLSLLAISVLCGVAYASLPASPLLAAEPDAASPAATLTAPPAGPAPQPRIWSGLVLATNGPNPAKPQGLLQKVVGKLHNIFGYNQFQVIGESSDKFDSNEHWLVPSKEFYMIVRGPAGPGTKAPTKIVLFQNRKKLAELEAHIAPDKPLFIRGPQYDQGQLVIVVRYADAAEFSPGPAPGGAAAMDAAVIRKTTPVGPEAAPVPSPDHEHLLLPGMTTLPKDRLQPFYPQSDKVIPTQVTPVPDAGNASPKP
jgi:hypothetical protein